MGDVRLIWNDGSTPDFGFDVYLSEVDCKDGGPYDSVLACVNKGWGQKNPRCLHSAGVTCKTNGKPLTTVALLQTMFLS